MGQFSLLVLVAVAILLCGFACEFSEGKSIFDKMGSWFKKCHKKGDKNCKRCAQMDCMYCMNDDECYKWGDSKMKKCNDYQAVHHKGNCDVSGKTTYSEKRAYYLWRLSRLVYHNEPDTNNCTTLEGVSDLTVYKVNCPGSTNCRAMIGYATTPTQNAIVAIFSGSESPEQNTQMSNSWWENFMLGNKPTIKAGSKEGHVFGFYKKAYNSFKKAGLIDDLKTLVATYGNDSTVWVAGHSLGGAVGSLLAVKVGGDKIISDKNNLHLYTFGSPRSGSPDFVSMVHSYVGHSYRVVHHTDEVPQHPWKGPNSAHFKTEVWYPQNKMRGKLKKVCDKAEDSRCSAMVSDVEQMFGNWGNTKPHYNYFDMTLDGVFDKMDEGDCDGYDWN